MDKEGTQSLSLLKIRRDPVMELGSQAPGLPLKTLPVYTLALLAFCDSSASPAVCEQAGKKSLRRE